MKKFLVALELLGVSDFKTAKLSLSTLFNSLDEEYPGATGEENKDRLSTQVTNCLAYDVRRNQGFQK